MLTILPASLPDLGSPVAPIIKPIYGVRARTGPMIAMKGGGLGDSLTGGALILRTQRSFERSAPTRMPSKVCLIPSVPALTCVQNTEGISNSLGHLQ